MNSKEKETLNTLITMCEEEGSRRYAVLKELLWNVELHIDYPSGWARNVNRELISYTFKCNDKDSLIDLKNDSKILGKLCADYLNLDGLYELPLDEDGDPAVNIIKAKSIEPLPMPPKVTFEKCKEKVIELINDAGKHIFAAVAWFTNPDIMAALLKKSKEGVIIFIIVDADEKNKNFLKKYKQLSFPVVCALNMNGEWKNLMHHKFCIIDNNVVLHGTFNWTVKADYNDEDIIENREKEMIDKYFERFKELRCKYNGFYNYSV